MGIEARIQLIQLLWWWKYDSFYHHKIFQQICKFFLFVWLNLYFVQSMLGLSTNSRIIISSWVVTIISYVEKQIKLAEIFILISQDTKHLFFLMLNHVMHKWKKFLPTGINISTIFWNSNICWTKNINFTSGVGTEIKNPPP